MDNLVRRREIHRKSAKTNKDKSLLNSFLLNRTVLSSFESCIFGLGGSDYGYLRTWERDYRIRCSLIELTEDWGETLFSALSKAGGKAFSNMVVGYNNVDVEAANKCGIAVGNTPGVLSETTAKLAGSISLAAARRIVEAYGFMRAGLYEGWLPHL